ncbi:hypothetical protein HRbin29_00645 [bacterium HR29]|nr:hypothetical protein HRbin29_00645 [bacterium HR29]
MSRTAERWYRAAVAAGVGFVPLPDGRCRLLAPWALDARLRTHLDHLKAAPGGLDALLGTIRRASQPPARQPRHLLGWPLTTAERRGSAIFVRLRLGRELDTARLLGTLTRLAQEFAVAPDRGSALWLIVKRGSEHERFFCGHVLDCRALRFTLARIVASAHVQARGRGPKS